MLANLLAVPVSVQDWVAYSRSHRTSHDLIRAAIQSQFKQNLPEYVLDPIDDKDVVGFLERNQQSHYEAQLAASVYSVNLGSVDFRDPEQLAAWIGLHYKAHESLEDALGIGS